MTNPLVKWGGSFADESGWKRELYEYLASTDIDKIALGKMPISVQQELQKLRATEHPDANAITTLATLLITCQQIHGHKSEGVVGESAIAAIYAAYLMDATMTTTGKSPEHHGLTFTISIAPGRDEPFMMATFLARYVREGFPDKFASDPSLDANVRFEERIAVIREPQMIGPYVKSPNKRFALVWSDSHDGSEGAEGSSGWMAHSKMCGAQSPRFGIWRPRSHRRRSAWRRRPFPRRPLGSRRLVACLGLRWPDQARGQARGMRWGRGGPSGRIALWKDDTVRVTDDSLTVIGSIEQPEVTGNRVRDVAWDTDGASIWVSGKGVWKVAVR